jgi:hypothetical protein
MKASSYPPMHWRDLTPEELAARLETADDLLNVLQWHRGDPKLNHWEEGFLTGMVRKLQKYRGKVAPTPKEWDKIRLILEKLDLDTEDSGETEAEETL